MHLWDTRPDIIAQVSTFEAATANPKDTSAFVSRPSPLDVLAAPASRKAKSAKSKRKATRSRSRKQAVHTKESEESEESDESDESDEADESEESDELDESEESDDEEEAEWFGRPCRNKRGKPYKKCSDCPFFAKHKVCKYYHADAPAGTTGLRSSLNKKSNMLLTRLGGFKPYSGGYKGRR
jgi:hypothetical protein